MYIEESVMGHIITITAITLICWVYVWVKNKISLKRKYERWAK